MSEWIRARRLEANRKQGNDMSDIREADKWLENNPICDADDLNKRERELVNAAWQAALSANGGEVEPVAWAVFADNGNIRIWGREKPEAFPEAVPLYLSPTVKDFLTVQSEPIGYADPDSLNDYRAGDRLHMPVYRPDASADWQDGVPVYLHPAPPSVAVPEGWKLVPIKPTDGMLDIDTEVQGNSHWHGNVDLTERRLLELWRDMLTAAPSPDHSGDAGKVGPVDDSDTVYRIGDLGNQIHNLGCSQQNNEELADYLAELAHQAWNLQGELVRERKSAPSDTPSVPENEIKAQSITWAAEYIREQNSSLIVEDLADDLDYEAARLRTAGDEGEGL